jgi:RNA 3'-terminal phosphate cyclase (ATP)
VSGAEHGSRGLTYAPNGITHGGSFTADPHTAGATTLLLQVALPLLVFSPEAPATTAVPSTLTLRGGTNATNAPQIDYTQRVFLPFVARHWGLHVGLDVLKRGYYPKGGGEVRVSVPPVRGPLRALRLRERGAVRRVGGRAYVAGVLPLLVAQKMESAARETLRAALAAPIPWVGTAQRAALLAGDPGAAAFDPASVEIDVAALKEEAGDAVGSGSGIVLWAETEDGCVFGASAVGRKGFDARKVGAEVAAELVRALESGGCVDEYLQVS